jgi:glyoxylase-like metal-dependent hydrolase (beta-lactamase superfamily II)
MNYSNANAVVIVASEFSLGGNMKYVLVTILLLASARAFAGDDFSKQIVTAHPLTKSIFMIEGAGGNITASIGPDGVLLVDDDFVEMADKLLAKLKELNGASPRFIINTHFHYDHTGGNKIFGKTATIIATNEVRERLSATQRLWGEDHPPYPEAALPTVTYEDTLNLHLNGEDIRVVHVKSGHTDGDSVVFFKNSNVVSMGDLYFSGMYPIFHPEHRGSLRGFMADIKSVIDQIPKESQIVPGHGPLSSKAELERYYRMIQASVATVQAGITHGLTLKQIQKAGLPREWKPFSHGYLTTDQWLALVYKGLKSQ